jgi:hypothetical protein
MHPFRIISDFWILAGARRRCGGSFRFFHQSITTEVILSSSTETEGRMGPANRAYSQLQRSSIGAPVLRNTELSDREGCATGYQNPDTGHA